MKKLRIYSLLIIAAHWVVGVWHLLLVAKILPAPENNVSWIAISLFTLLHCGVAVACWKLSDRLSGLILCVFLVVALGSGIYEHFLAPGLNNIFRVPPSDWTAAFRASVFLLVVVEILGCWFGIRLSRGNRETKIKAAY
jgi:hypothetical protein